MNYHEWYQKKTWSCWAVLWWKFGVTSALLHLTFCITLSSNDILRNIYLFDWRWLLKTTVGFRIRWGTVNFFSRGHLPLTYESGLVEILVCATTTTGQSLSFHFSVFVCLFLVFFSKSSWDSWISHKRQKALTGLKLGTNEDDVKIRRRSERRCECAWVQRLRCRVSHSQLGFFSLKPSSAALAFCLENKLLDL